MLQKQFCLYLKFQEFFRKYQPPTFGGLGKNDPFWVSRCPLSVEC